MRESRTYGSVRGARSNSRPLGAALPGTLANRVAFRLRKGASACRRHFRRNDHENFPAVDFLHLAAGAAALPAVSARSHGRKPIRRGRCASSSALPPAARYDIVARLIGQWLSERLGQPFVIENRPGAATNIATEVVVNAPADGYTLLLVGVDERDQRHALREAQFQFHPRYRASCEHHSAAPGHGGAIRRFQLRQFPSSSPMPRPIQARSTCPRPASGSISHLAGELFKMMAGVDMVHVPYQRQQPCTDGLAWRTGGGIVRLASLVDRVHQNWQAARTRGNHRDALGGAAGPSGRRRVCAGLRGERVVRRGRAKGHACRGHR